jgi:hypothetical protein
MAKRPPRTTTPTELERARAARPTLVEYQAISVELNSAGELTARHLRMDPTTKKIVTESLTPQEVVEDCEHPLAHALAEAGVEWLHRVHGWLDLR